MRPDQVWLKCLTHDIQFMSRSLESTRHGAVGCEVVLDDPNKAVRDAYWDKLLNRKASN